MSYAPCPINKRKSMAAASERLIEIFMYKTPARPLVPRHPSFPLDIHLYWYNGAQFFRSFSGSRRVLPPQKTLRKASTSSPASRSKGLATAGQLARRTDRSSMAWVRKAQGFVRCVYSSSFTCNVFYQRLPIRSSGPISRLNVFGMNIIILNDMKLAVEMFDKRSTNYSDRPNIVFGCEM